jgi:hypothetical protein
MKPDFYRQIFEKYSNIKFHENPSSYSRVFPCGMTEWQTGVTYLIVAFRNFPKAPKDLPSLVISNDIATGFSDYIIFF